MRSAFLLLFCLCIGSAAVAQTTILDVEPQLDSIDKKFGPNRLHFVHVYIGYGLNIGNQDPTARIKTASSNQVEAGLRYKLKLSNTLSLTGDVGFQSLQYNLIQEKGKTVPDTMLHDRERFITQNFVLGGYLRINIGDRGDNIGRFISAGGGLLARIRKQYERQDELPNGEMELYSLYRLQTITPVQYFTEIRIGFNRWVFFASKRMTPFFTDVSDYPAMPAYSIGLQLGLH